MPPPKLLIATIALFCACPPLFAGQERGDYTPVAEFAVGTEGRPLLVPVEVGGGRFLFCLDTGAAKTALDSRIASTLGAPRGEVSLATSAGIIRTPVYRCPEATLGGLDLRRVGEVACVDLMPIRRVTGQEVCGVIGMDFLGRCAVEIDFDAGRVRLWDSAPAAWRNESRPVPIVFEAGRPTVEVALPRGRAERFVLDTGANVSTLRGPVFDAMRAEGTLSPAGGTRAVTAGGEAIGRCGYVDRIELGGLPRTRHRTDRDRFSALGLRYLSRFRLRMDFPGRTAYLTAGRRYAEPPRLATSGLSVLVDHGCKVVAAVEPGSPAAEAGLRPGDVVAAVNGDDASRLDLFAVGQSLTAGVGDRVTVRVEREDGPAEATLVLKSRL